MIRLFKKTLHRRLLEEQIIRIAPQVNGDVLEIGSKNKRYNHLFTDAVSITSTDIIENPEFGVTRADVMNLPFTQDTYDTVIMFEVMEYIEDVTKALREINRVLKQEGTLIFSVPFFSSVHGNAEVDDEQTDLIRMTIRGWAKLLSDDYNLSNYKVIGNRWTAVIDVFLNSIKNMPKVMKVILLPLILFLKVAARLCMRYRGDKHYPTGYLIICTKK